MVASGGATLRESKISEPKAALDSVLSGGLRAFPRYSFSAFRFSIGSTLDAPSLRKQQLQSLQITIIEKKRQEAFSSLSTELSLMIGNVLCSQCAVSIMVATGSVAKCNHEAEFFILFN